MYGKHTQVLAIPYKSSLKNLPSVNVYSHCRVYSILFPKLPDSILSYFQSCQTLIYPISKVARLYSILFPKLQDSIPSYFQSCQTLFCHLQKDPIMDRPNYSKPFTFRPNLFLRYTSKCILQYYIEYTVYYIRITHILYVLAYCLRQMYGKCQNPQQNEC